jgi:hypothetical protein
MTKKYYQVPPMDVANHWSLFSALIDKAMTKAENDDYTMEGVFNRLINNQWQLFVIIDGEELESIFVSCVIHFDTRKYLNPIFITSNTDKKVDLGYMQQCLEDIAKAFGCNRIMGGGRAGWKKALSRFGYKDLNLVVKEL